MSKLEEQKALPRRRLFGPDLSVRSDVTAVNGKLQKPARKAKKAKGKR